MRRTLFSVTVFGSFFLLFSTAWAGDLKPWQKVDLPNDAIEVALSIDESAKLLAGLPVRGIDVPGLKKFKSFSGQWKARKVWRYKAYYERNSYITSNKIIAYQSAMKDFQKEHFSTATKKQVVYPFGGVDAIFPTLLFDFDRMLTIGREPTGDLAMKFFQSEQGLFVKLNSSFFELGHAIESICYSLASLPFRTFSVTDSMAMELGGGVAVAYLVQLATMGATINHVVLKDRELSISYFYESPSSEKTLTYLSYDLRSADSLKKIDDLLIHTDSILFLKATTYMLFPRDDNCEYSAEFRPFIEWIQGSSKIKQIVQTVSGLPWAFFKSNWKTKFFGAYLPVIMWPAFKGTKHGMMVDEGLMRDFYKALNGAKELTSKNTEIREQILKKDVFVQKNYPELRVNKDLPDNCGWSGPLAFPIGYPGFLSRMCSSYEGPDWNAKSYPTDFDPVSFLMIAERKE